MRNGDEYKKYVSAVDPEIAKDIKETEEIAAIVSAMIEKRKALGLTQRDLAAMCKIPQSSVARIESCKITPNLRTLLNILYQLGLTLTVAQREQIPRQVHLMGRTKDRKLCLIDLVTTIIYSAISSIFRIKTLPFLPGIL